MPELPDYRQFGHDILRVLIFTGQQYLENYELLKTKGIIDFANCIDDAIDKHATTLYNECETSTFSEEEKENLYDSFKYPYEEGINWAYDNYEE